MTGFQRKNVFLGQKAKKIDFMPVKAVICSCVKKALIFGQSGSNYVGLILKILGIREKPKISGYDRKCVGGAEI